MSGVSISLRGDLAVRICHALMAGARFQPARPALMASRWPRAGSRPRPSTRCCRRRRTWRGISPGRRGSGRGRWPALRRRSARNAGHRRATDCPGGPGRAEASAEGSVMALRIEVSSWRWYSSTGPSGSWRCGRCPAPAWSARAGSRPWWTWRCAAWCPKPEAQLGLQLVQAILDVLARAWPCRGLAGQPRRRH